MSALLRLLVSLLLFWISLFLIQESVFLFFDAQRLVGIGSIDIRQAFLHGLPMDIATACYLILPVALCTIVLTFREIPGLRKVLRPITAVFVVLSCIIHVCDIGLFTAWGTKVNHKAISYLIYPEEALAAAAGAPVGQLIVILLAEIAIAFLVLFRIDHAQPYHIEKGWLRWSLALLLPIVLIVGMRGGTQPYPIDRSWSYHSAHPILNLGALNGTWNFIVLLAEPPEIGSNPYMFLSAEEAKERSSALYPRTLEPPRSVLTTEQPNIILVLLESWTADVVGVLGGDTGVTPGFDRAAQDGVLFTNFYSTGFRTEQGLCAIISGFPSQPKTTIIRQYGKFDRLPSFTNVLDSAGYHSTYFYAGDVAFANTRAYLEAMGFDHVHDENSFPIKNRTRWGAYDEELFEFHLREAENAATPFFHVLMTSTSHEPFDVPIDEGFPGKDPSQQYRNSVHYTDRTLGAFLDRCKQQPWYRNTLIVVVADHGHYLPYDRASHMAERHHIPLLFTGGALDAKYHGTQNTTFGCHVDLPKTLMGQLGLAPFRSSWGADLFDTTVPHFAFWTFDDGFGIADPSGVQVFDNLSGLLLQESGTATTVQKNEQLTNGKALEQTLLDQYIELSQ